MERPIIAITLGDPSGIGPEIVAKALADPQIYKYCRPLVIGDSNVFRRAQAFCGLSYGVQSIDELSEAKYEFGEVDVLGTGEYDVHSLRMGKEQKLAGEMAYAWILKGIELGMAKKVQAVVTGPIHKGAIKLVGVKEAGHTEIFQAKTDSSYALTMFACGKLRVFFASRHISLKDACNLVNKDMVLENLRNIHKELVHIGIPKPTIALAALNPHCGDYGLFGDEELTDLIPAVEQAKAEGLHVVGPVPADSVFHLGKEGAYDGILSLYHDQGHIACKTLDFYGTVSLTLGLPFLRGSVDHGTAFDIAGKGVASEIGMKEAIRVTTLYAKKMM